MDKDRTTLYTIFLVLAICIVALVAVIYTFIVTLRTLRFGQVKALEPDRPIDVFLSRYNYNFKIPTEADVQALDPRPEKDKTEQTQDVEYRTVNYNFHIPALNKLLPQIHSIQIPSIKYNAPVIVNNNTDHNVSRGLLFYPSSKHPFSGETILLCDTRYLNGYNPMSCLNLSKIQEGDTIYLNLSNHTQINYRVISISIVQSNDMDMYSSSNKRLLKIISTSRESTQNNSDLYSTMILAKAID